MYRMDRMANRINILITIKYSILYIFKATNSFVERVIRNDQLCTQFYAKKGINQPECVLRRDFGLLSKVFPSAATVFT